MNEKWYMERYATVFINSFREQVAWTWKAICWDVPWYLNYFWGLIIISVLVWGLELIRPWRKQQAAIRGDFWLDAGYMFFNFFLFSIAIAGGYAVIGLSGSDIGLSMSSFTLIPLAVLPTWAQLVVFFILLDFVQWITHLLLHKLPVLWEFHKIHHSVKEMGFAAHLRYHWMENLLYKPLKTLGVMLLGGLEPEQAYIVHFIAITIGHLNHANLKVTWGPLKYIFNNPVMHLYHHAYQLPKGRFGVNFGISLSVWDYLFGTDYVPESSGTIPLGFEGDEQLPKGFLGQLLHGFGRRSRSSSSD